MTEVGLGKMGELKAGLGGVLESLQGISPGDIDFTTNAAPTGEFISGLEALVNIAVHAEGFTAPPEQVIQTTMQAETDLALLLVGHTGEDAGNILGMAADLDRHAHQMAMHGQHAVTAVGVMRAAIVFALSEARKAHVALKAAQNEAGQTAQAHALLTGAVTAYYNRI